MTRVDLKLVNSDRVDELFVKALLRRKLQLQLPADLLARVSVRFLNNFLLGIRLHISLS